MLTAVEIQKLKDQIEALDDEALIAEAHRLRGLARGIPRKLAEKWGAMIAEAVADLEPDRTFGRKREARARLRGFCLELRKHESAA
jgi:hypothetical protein